MKQKNKILKSLIFVADLNKGGRLLPNPRKAKFTLLLEPKIRE